jgi:hypothetical protein
MTSTSPSGMHLGHYKALVLHNDLDLTSSKANKRKAIICAHVAMINYAIKHTYSYQRWQNIVNVMIEKGARQLKSTQVTRDSSIWSGL